MRVDDMLSTARDAITVKRVFGEPYEKDGTTVIPAAAVSGGFGGGSGTDDKGQDGGGGGFGVRARPLGAFVIKDGAATWQPAVDPARLLAVIGAVVVVFLVTRRPRRPSRLRRAGR